jgi:hypothetical protein
LIATSSVVTWPHPLTDIDRLTIEERNTLMKEEQCFKCKQQGHLSKECNQGYQPQTTKPLTQKKKMGGTETANYIRTLVATMDDDEKKKFEENLEAEGLGF